MAPIGVQVANRATPSDSNPADDFRIFSDPPNPGTAPAKPGHAKRAAVVARRVSDGGAERTEIDALQQAVQRMSAALERQTSEAAHLRAEILAERASRLALETRVHEMAQAIRSVHPGLLLEPTFEGHAGAGAAFRL